jgi:archaellum component FlaC
MAEPTLADVLKAISELDAKTDKRFDQADKRFDQADKRFDRIEKLLGAVDRDLTGHMEVHAKIEKDIEGLKRRTAPPVRRAPKRRAAR